VKGVALPRLFISHTSKDNIHALAFQRWLELKGWSTDDVFIDLHDMQAGEKWRETLVKANVACEALLFLASPESLASDECRREVRRAEDDRKEVIVAILRGVTIDDPRLAGYTDRQIMDLSTKPREERVEVEHNGQRHLIDFNRAALNAIHAKLIDWGIAPDAFAWPPRHNPKALPYPGLDAFDEHSTGIFFGREADVMAGIRDLRLIRHRGSPRLLVIQAASGAGKSSFLRAGLWPRLGRTVEFVPLVIVRPATGIITGQHGLGQGLSQWFGERRRQVAPGTIHAELMAGDAAAGAQRLAVHISAAVALVAEERALNLAEGHAQSRLSPLIAVDQGEELFAAEHTAQSDRFLNMMGHLLGSPPNGLDPYVLMTIRANSVGALLQRVPTLGLVTPHTIMLPPLSPAAYRDVITKPAEVYTRQVARLDLEPDLVEALVKDASGADALPLLAFTLQRLFLDYAPVRTLTKAHYDTMGGIEGSIDRKLAEAKVKAGTTGTDVNLRRLIVPALATWDAAANAAKRLVPNETDVIAGDRAGLAPLANALVEARLLTRGGATLEVAHEALLRRRPISGWLDQEKDALKLRDDVLREAKEWADSGRHAESLVRRGERLRAGLALATRVDFRSALAAAAEYLRACRKLDRLIRRTQIASFFLLSVILLSVILGLLAWMKPPKLVHFTRVVTRPYTLTQIRPYALTDAQERALAPLGHPFTECARNCPKMILLPAGPFVMGEGANTRLVTIAKPFAVSEADVTFDDWDACVAYGDCEEVVDRWGRGQQPVINVTLANARHYAEWLSTMTGKHYRLLTEAEWEYAARAGTQTTYSFGDDSAMLQDYAWFNRNSNGQAHPVRLKKPNNFGLYDMGGNVYQWVEDCWHLSGIEGIPNDGSAWMTNCDPNRQVVRGGSWLTNAATQRSAQRSSAVINGQNDEVGFRVARDLSLR
jgi:formylglycine-generating enzyme required for sulfatase activity